MSAGAAGDPAVGRIGQIAIAVTEPDRSVAFYRDALGLPLLFQAPPALAFLDMAGIRLMLDGSAAAGSPAGASQPGGDPVGGNDGVVLYFAVDDLGAAHRALSGRGVVFEREPHMVARMPDHELWMAFFRDPDGHLLALMSEVRE